MATPEQLAKKREIRRHWTPAQRAQYKKDYQAWRKKNPDYAAKALKQWVKDNPERWAFLRWKTAIKKLYGITLEQYETMFKAQRGKCAICKIQPLKILHIDHCHKSKKVRGLLCRKCNTGLGFFGDNPKLLERAINYLRKK